MLTGTHHIDSESATLRLAAEFAHTLQPGDVVSLLGPLGAGKTTFVRGILRAMGYEGRVRSPTFILINPYPTDPAVHHADVYRLNDPEELVALGLEDIRDDGGVLLVEWADRMPELDNDATWRITITPDESGLDRRVIDVVKVSL